jgi:putative tryptophan/tyrosine transport system substrate-binding protein
MKRREFLATAPVLALPGLARAQKTPTVGLLWNDSVKPSPYIAVLSEALRHKGYVVGRNLRFEDAVALEGYSPIAENAASLVRRKVDLIVTYGATATVAAARATKEIPIVTVMGVDPVAMGLAKSLSRPGANVSGVWTLSVGLHGKRMELLKQLVPGLARMGVLHAPESAAAQRAYSEVEAAGETLKLTLVRAEVRSSDDIEPAVARLAQQRVGAAFVTASSLLSAHGAPIVQAMAKNRLPAMYSTERFADAGGLLVYASSARKAFARATNHIDLILKGARAADIPIEQTNDVDLIINLKTARELGLAIPQSILQRADRAIE